MTLFDNIEQPSTLCAFGWLTIVYIAARVISWLYKFVVVNFTEPTIDWTKYGKWALVTGATDGIGKCIARELAQRGKNIFLVSRNIDKLKRVAKEIEVEFNVDTKILAFDFCSCDQDLQSSPYDAIKEAIKNTDIGIMVNNVGMAGRMRRFTTGFSSPEKHWKFTTDIVNCNATSRTKMMQLILPGMLDRKEGLIINVSSLSSRCVCPLLSIYGATKRFDSTLSVSVGDEYRKHGVVIVSVEPGLVQTNMTYTEKGIISGKWKFPTAPSFVSQMMNTIGKSVVVNGYWAHSVIQTMYSMIPESRLARMVKKEFEKVNKE